MKTINLNTFFQNLQVDPLSTISAIRPNVTHGHQNVKQPAAEYSPHLYKPKSTKKNYEKWLQIMYNTSNLINVDTIKIQKPKDINEDDINMLSVIVFITDCE